MALISRPWIKLFFAMIFVLFIFAIFRVLNIDFSAFSEDAFRKKIETLGIWGPAFYVLIYVLRPFIFFPASILSAAAGVIWGPFEGFIYLQIAANTSASLEFFFARYSGRDIVKKYIKDKFFNIDERIAKHAFLTVLLIRLIPNVAWDIQNLALGLTKVKFRDYFLATLIGIMPGSFALVFFGFSLLKVVYRPENFWILIIALLIISAVYYIKNSLKSRYGKKINK